MATLREIRKRLHSVNNIKQITKAMEMVAGAHLRRAEARAKESRPYTTKMIEMMEHLAATDIQHPLLETRKIKKTGLVIVAADKGLCGAYNNDLFTTAENLLRNYDIHAVELILFGRRAIEHYKNKKWTIRYEMSHWGGKITFHQIKTLSNMLVNWFLSGEMDEILVVYTHFISIFSRKIVIEKFLNIEKPKKAKLEHSLDYILEPNAQEIYAELLPRYCMIKLQNALQEAYASELAARIVSMSTATKNANEMIDSLTIIRNKVRQTNITKEMLEIISGSESVK